MAHREGWYSCRVDTHVLFGIVSAGLGVFAYAFYLRSILAGDTKPHIFTWLIYFLLDAVVFPAQVLKGAGPGSWVTLTGVIGTGIVTLLALRFGEKHITRLDQVSLALALMAFVPWLLTGDPLFSVVLAAGIDLLAMAPTFRKSYRRPHEESTSIWLIDAVRFTLSLYALSIVTITTALYPAVIVIGNTLLVALILMRRRVDRRRVRA